MYTRKPDLSEPRWGGYIPWFLRYKDFNAKGNFLLFFERLSQRLDRMFTYNEPNIPNLLHFGDWLETESLQRFRHDRTKLLNNQLKAYFNPETLKREFSIKIYQDSEVRKAQEILMHYEKTGPDFHEIRYLLFSICNIALLLLDYPRNNEKILNTNETTD